MPIDVDSVLGKQIFICRYIYSGVSITLCVFLLIMAVRDNITDLELYLLTADH